MTTNPTKPASTRMARLVTSISASSGDPASGSARSGDRQARTQGGCQAESLAPTEDAAWRSSGTVEAGAGLPEGALGRCPRGLLGALVDDLAALGHAGAGDDLVLEVQRQRAVLAGHQVEQRLDVARVELGGV